jgi:hypothetical protein
MGVVRVFSLDNHPVEFPVVQKRAHVSLSEGLLTDIDHLFGKGKRSADTTKHEMRRAVVDPILKAKQWTVNKWGTQAGVGKNCAYEYLDGRRNLSTANRVALAQVLGLTAEDLPN